MALREDTTLREVLRLLELTLCRELRRPMIVSVNKKIVREGACKFQKIGNHDNLEISEAVSVSGPFNPGHAIKSTSHSKYDMTRSAHMRKSLLNKDVLSEYRKKIKSCS